MKFSGVIFDLNGVLFWDSQFHEQAWQQSASTLRGRPLLKDEFLETVHGRSNASIFSYLLGHPVSGVELQKLIDLKESNYRRLCLENPNSFVLSPGAQELFETLVANQIPMTIATGSEITNLQFFIEHFELDRWFGIDQLVFDDGVIAGKPAPDMYRLAAQKIGLNPSDCIVVEDAASGIKAAYAAGIGCVIALGSEPEQERLKVLDESLRVIESLEEFPKDLLFGF
jgi:beta-phosphoglucomutase-like phosphatase (HAD superfamily)